MTELITRSGAWLLQTVQAAALPDTIVMKTMAAERGWFETITGIASAVLTLTILALAIVFGPAAWSFWRKLSRVSDLFERVYADLTPLTRHASNIADNVEYITSSIRNDVQQVNATIVSANRRLQQAVALTEKRLNDFNALLQVVQQEAEQAFVSTAAAVRGVRTGAATLSGMHDAGDVVGYADDGEEEDENGDDNEFDEDAADGGQGTAGDTGSLARKAARPRLRSRHRRRQ
jgi:uncharacterized protein YoxC